MNEEIAVAGIARVEGETEKTVAAGCEDPRADVQKGPRRDRAVRDQPDPAGLQRARGLLKAAMEMAEQGDPLVPKIRGLMARIDEELPS